MESIILEKVKNIGSLCLFLNNPVNKEYLELTNKEEFYHVNVGQMFNNEWYWGNSPQKPISNDWKILKWQWMPLP